VSDATASAGLKASIDWAGIRNRVERATAAIENAAVPTAARKAEILKARARALAREPLQDRKLGHSVEVVEFMLAYERYALDSSLVREVQPLKDITALPGTPAFVAGIVNVRGQIVSVIDLKRFFDLPDKGLSDLHKVIILDDGQMVFGLLVDAVIAVHRLPLDQIQPAPPTLTGIRAEYLQGVTAHRMVILNAARILADPAMICSK
jgi:purine-binding chemotaxis protein CheW